MTADPLTAHLLNVDATWMASAACAREPDLPWTGGATGPDGDLMCAICAACPVLAECERFAVDAKITAGWWAGRSFSKYDVHHPPGRDLITRGGDAA